ncbi:hypothetical protein D7Y55_05780 [Stenotrophomonas maltophilia]|nr:hypothetical protein [Stenotrophomonas maltophilia]
MLRELIERNQPFALDGLIHRGIGDSEDKGSDGHVTEAMRQLYDHSVPAVEVAVKLKKNHQSSR